ncbi:YbfB/YjiJ family MFS transporter [Hoeflea poritis]|uniref:YbfB/YjiJ family MFS transporter n=1 Tax=Hoeflea poritis TaxID=2993659 RepID=A0ABT4VJK3_9HYPH|nr:YbfB/YjiJ family MFS transporter [Hoeflea poritis]MDA4844894.1 YbfB/YjiJ family MFS transporter [Hoeflea poritis]
MFRRSRKAEAFPAGSQSNTSVVWLAAGGLVAMAVAMGLGRFVYTPLLPDLMLGLGLNPADAGLIASANYLGYLLGAVLAAYGWAAGIERLVFLGGLAATTLLLAAVAFADGVLALSIIRFAAGIASAFGMIFVSTIIFSHLDAANRHDLQAVHFSGVGLGMIISALLLLVLLRLDAPWQVGWYASAAIALLGTLFAAVIIRAEPVRSANGNKEPPLVWDRSLVLISIAYGLFGMGYIVTATFLVAIVRGDAGQSPLEAWVWMATGGAAAISLFAWAPFRRRFSLFAAFSTGCVIEAVGVAVSVLVPLPFGPFVGGTLLGATFVAITAFGLQAGRLLAGQSPRRALAIMTACFGTGQIIGPVVAGFLAELSGSYTSGSLVAALALIVAAALATLAATHAPGT